MTTSKRHFLDSFFYPESVAVVGAARNPGTLNFFLLSNLVSLKFPGKIYPVNPNAEEILGLKAYPNLRSIKDDVDLAVVAVPAAKTLDIVHDCVAKKVKGVTLVPGGFSEIGEGGKKLQAEILSLLSEHGIRAIGPNALTPVNSRNNLVISFHPLQELPQGNLSFIFQSGLYEPRFNWLFSGLHLYISKLIDLGNKMDITEVDALEYLAQDPETTVIALHLESIAGNARKLLQLMKETTKEKPVIVLKSGRTSAGAEAALSHTGAIIQSSDTIVDAALKQSRVIRVQGLDEFFDMAKTFEYLPSLKNNKIAVASGSGGEGVITTDLCQLSGFRMAQLSEDTRNRLHPVFPPWGIPVNPLDAGVCGQFNPGFDVNGIFLDALVNDPNVDCAALALQPLGYSRFSPDEFIKPFLNMMQTGKPIVTWVTDPASGKEMIEQLESNRIPVYSSAERAVDALSALYKYYSMREATD